ncbi:MAG: hypothetical protein ACREDO_07785 [Methyloceanibacter sp.]
MKVSAALSLAPTLLLVPLIAAPNPESGAAGAKTFAGPVDIGGGRNMYLARRGRGFPTVVLVGGLRASADDWSLSENSAPPVFASVAKFTRVCAYDRSGTPVGEKPSRSDPVPKPVSEGKR